MAAEEARQDFLPMTVEDCPDMDLLTPVEEQRHRWTLERVAKNQERMDAIRRALACGVPVLTVCEVFRVSAHTIGVLTEREPELVASGKKRLAAKFRYGAHLALESCIQDIQDGKLPPASKPITAGIFSDKSQQLDGEPGLVVEHRHTIDPAMLAEQAQAWVNEALPVSALPDNELGAGDAVEDAGGAVSGQPTGDDPAGDSEQEGGGRQFSGGCG